MGALREAAAKKVSRSLRAEGDTLEKAGRLVSAPGPPSSWQLQNAPNAAGMVNSGILPFETQYGVTVMMTDTTARPRLTLGHSTIAVRDLDRLVAFYRDVLGFHLTNRGPIGEGEMAFLSQDPSVHHQIAMVAGVPVAERSFRLVDHLAFRTGSLDDLRRLRAALVEAGVEEITPLCHGNAWSLYFDDPEGNGIECYVDSPFHVAQPQGKGFDLDRSDEEIAQATREQFATEPEFRPMAQWQEEFEKLLDQG
jgi:catechol 2,3-dioxygenase-like lactoylglutathione lyase family enzyme